MSLPVTTQATATQHFNTELHDEHVLRRERELEFKAELVRWHEMDMVPCESCGNAPCVCFLDV